MKVFIIFLLTTMSYVFAHASAPVKMDRSTNNILEAEISSEDFLIVNVAMGAKTIFKFPEPPTHTELDFSESYEHYFIEPRSTNSITLRPLKEVPSRLYIWTASGRQFNFRLDFVEYGKHNHIVDVAALVSKNPNYQHIDLAQLLYAVRNYDFLSGEHKHLKNRMSRHQVDQKFRGDHLSAQLTEIYRVRKPDIFIVKFTVKNTSLQRLKIKNHMSSYWFLERRSDKALIKPNYRKLSRVLLPPGAKSEFIGIFKYTHWKPSTVFDIHVSTDLYGHEKLVMLPEE